MKPIDIRYLVAKKDWNAQKIADLAEVHVSLVNFAITDRRDGPEAKKVKGIIMALTGKKETELWPPKEQKAA